VAVDYRATVAHPRTRAYSAQIYQSDHGLSLRLRPGHVVTVLGYLGEPVMRLDASGLSFNAASPTARAMHLVDRAHAVTASAPRWRLQRGRHSVVWHDARVQGLPPGLAQGVWRVPLVIDGRNGLLSGRLRRFPDPPLWLWLAALACWLAVAALPLLGRRRDLVRTWAIAMALVSAAAATAVALAFALDAYASPGTWIVGADVIVFLAVGLEVLRRGPRHLRVAAAIWLGFVSLALCSCTRSCWPSCPGRSCGCSCSPPSAPARAPRSWARRSSARSPPQHRRRIVSRCERDRGPA
jgi:hypothetical protein